MVEEIQTIQNQKLDVHKEKLDLSSKKINLDELTIVELKEKAKQKKIKNYSKMKKDELIKVLS